MGFWDRKKVLVTGGGGFIGSHVVELLLKSGRGVKVTVGDHAGPIKRRNLKAVWKDVRFVNAELTDPAAARRLCRGQDVVINMVASVGGVGWNSVHPGSLFRDNMLLGLNIMEAARRADVGRYVVVSSACVYPRDCAIPTPESEGFRSVPEITNAGYGWAKRMQEFAGRAYQEEFGMEVAIARPYNAYGPRDHFDPERSHVIAALVKRVCDGENPVKVWGDGSTTRSFLFVEDFARGVLEVGAKYPKGEALNIGADDEISVRELAEMIIRLAGTKARLSFDLLKPSGQPRRRCDVSRAKKEIGFQARVGLPEGLAKTIEWYRKNEA
ncbi:MAG: NAD-dependent epimerase/dehydratase family protein [Elusimicrobia bacterium]|nr:NAD-dependent epimerase/dehydratase family protein [Elusimicrobiota bacterium]MDE2509538.1 NAD-dependent epimerase/dehydratase family protein [Elusimicrobiota bacterium]